MFEEAMSFEFTYPPDDSVPVAVGVMSMETAAPEILFDGGFTQLFHGHLIAFSDIVPSEEIGIKTLQKYLAVSIVVGILDINQAAIAAGRDYPLIL